MNIVKHVFRVLLVNHTQVSGMKELDWPLEKVCALEMSDLDKWTGNDAHWKEVFKGIHYVKDMSRGGESNDK